MMKAKVLKNEAEYEDALAYIETLMDAEPGSPEEEDLELFSLLVETYEEEHYPIDLPDPASAIKFRMDQQGLSRKDLVSYLGSMSRVSDVLNGKRPLSLAMIRSLHNGLAIPYEVLLREPGKTLPECQYKRNDYPFNEMFKRGYFETFTGTLAKAKEQVEELLESFFAICKGMESEIIFCRKNHDTVDRLALKAWQVRVMHLALNEKLPPYDKAKITEDVLSDVASLSRFTEGPKLVREVLNKKGIHFIILPHLDKTYLDGACFMATDGHPVIAMTLRYDRLDNFWFTLLHELAHLHLHLSDASVAFFDDTEKGRNDDSNIRENEADSLAGDILIPRTAWDKLDHSPTNTLPETEIQTLADDIKRSPAVIAGRIRWERNDYTLFAHLMGNKTVKRLLQIQN